MTHAAHTPHPEPPQSTLGKQQITLGSLLEVAGRDVWRVLRKQPGATEVRCPDDDEKGISSLLY